MKKRGVGRVYKRGNKWWLDYQGRKPDGQRGRIRQPGGRTKSEALARLEDCITLQSQGHATGPKAERLTVDDLMDSLIGNQEAQRLRSVYRTRAASTQLLAFFGGRKAMEVTAADVDAYILYRRNKGIADGTTDRELASLRRAYKLAVKWKLIPYGPHVPCIKLNNARQGFVDEGDIRALLHQMPEWLTAWTEFSYLAGWRPSAEVVSLTWADVDFENGLVSIEVGRDIYSGEEGTTKNDACKVWPFDGRPRLEEVLRRQRRVTSQLEREQGKVIKWVFHRDGRRLFDFKHGRAVLRPPVRAAWRAACERAGLAGLQPHDLRRSFVMQAERAGVPRSVAMKLTGHKSEKVYLRYAIAAEQQLREGAQKLAELDGSGTKWAQGDTKSHTLAG
jgi:integrase